MLDSELLKDIRPLPGQFLMAWPRWAKLVLAAGLTLATLWARLAFGHVPGDPPTLVLFLLPIMASAYVGGLWPGLLATLLSFAASGYYLLAPLNSFVISDVRNQISWLALLLAGTGISVLFEVLREDRRRLAGTIAALRRAEKFRQDVERIVRHDVKSPLLSLHAAATVLFEDRRAGEAGELLPDLVHSIRNVINLLDASDKIACMEQGGYAPQAAWFDLGLTLRNVGQSLRTLAGARGLALAGAGLLDPAAPPLQAFGEELLVENLLTNLVKNALEASSRNGTVTVDCGNGDGSLRIAVHNAGVVPEAVRSRFFEKYATAGKPFGTGLGTYSARLIARAHGGSIDLATSEAAGTTVTVTLPLPPRPPVA